MATVWPIQASPVHGPAGALVEPFPEPENAVLRDDSRIVLLGALASTAYFAPRRPRYLAAAAAAAFLIVDACHAADQEGCKG
jgi:hypothetical protein